MIKINKIKVMDEYIKKFNIDKLFVSDMKPFMELFLFKRNEYICKEGEKNKYIFFILKGKAKVYITLSNGKSLLNCFYSDFAIVGDIELIDLKNPATNVQAIEDTYCIGISLDNAREKLINDIKFLRYLCNSLGEKLNDFSKNSSINLLYPLENRLASYIYVTGERSKNGQLIKFNENLTQIAELLGTSYRHLLRTLKSFLMREILIKRGEYFEVIDLPKLKELASDLYK
ncbi:transcriptional regulator YeiL [Clostridium weizhouense]|uniref:Transcriptional regulator YeiL n=1 Tax=Clostridium weizhouense TaxID=2859781 RepID=A0ABS7AT02_9CLOT|nr:transcriptional regulator YeiL [Clostridium weizhouense]MBW6410595.1 transcriptional regulator YeiL [Clostridium weizhouense]